MAMGERDGQHRRENCGDHDEQAGELPPARASR
jgi:hypothetical protein